MNEYLESGASDPEEIEVEIISVKDVPVKDYVSIGFIVAGTALIVSMLVLGVISILRHA